jgi:hypothetical protein
MFAVLLRSHLTLLLLTKNTTLEARKPVRLISLHELFFSYGADR